MGLFSGFLRMLWENEQPHLKALDDPEAFARNYRVFFRAMGERDEFFPVFLEDDRLLESKGVRRDAQAVCRRARVAGMARMRA